MSLEVGGEEAYDVIWQPDTCDCIITYTLDFSRSKALKRCKIHEAIPDDQIFREVVEHNRSFNLKVFDPSDKERDERLRAEAKAAEKARSRREA